MKKYTIALLVAICAFAAVDLNAAPKLLSGKTKTRRMSIAEFNYLKLDDSGILAEINGFKITKEYVERRISLMDELAAMKENRSGRKSGKPDIFPRIGKMLRRIVEEHLLIQYATSAKITPSSQDVAAELKKIVERYYPEYANSTYRFYAKISKDNREAFRNYVRMRSTLEKTRLAIEGNVEISDEELAKAKSDNIAYNANARAVLAEIWNTASNDWKSATASGNFDALVKKYERGKNPHIYSDPEWGVFDLGFFRDDPEIVKALHRMKKGDVSEPVLGDFGLNLLKLTDREEVANADGGKECRYHLAQIFYELPAIRSEDEGEIKAEMVQKRKAGNYSAKLKELLSSAKIEYPNGTFAGKPLVNR